MAGPQFFTPQPVLSQRPRRRFTLLQANKALPLVRRVVIDIVATREKATNLQAMIEKLGGCEEQAVQKDLDQAIDRLHVYLDELTEIGCELKDFQIGLVDFVGKHQGRDVYLCWKLGEDTIGFFHELNSGVAGRVPVSKLQEE